VTPRGLAFTRRQRGDTVRTDMDAFTVAEIAVLENHGYGLADAACRQHASALMDRPDAPFVIPDEKLMDAGAVRMALRDSSRRSLLGRGFWPPWPRRGTAGLLCGDRLKRDVRGGISARWVAPGRWHHQRRVW
jgi:hypothetical protein